MLRKRWIHNVPQTCLRSSTPNSKFNLPIKLVADENLLPNPRPPTSSPPIPDLHHGNSLQLALGANYRVGRTRKREATAPIPDAPRKRIAHPQIYLAGGASSDHSRQTMRREHQGGEVLQNSAHNTPRRGCGGDWGSTTIYPTGNSNTWQNPNSVPTPSDGHNPNNGPTLNENLSVGPDPNWTPNAGSNHNQNKACSNSKQNPNTCSNPNRNPNVNSNPDRNLNPAPNRGRNSNTGANSNQNPNVGWKPGSEEIIILGSTPALEEIETSARIQEC